MRRSGSIRNRERGQAAAFLIVLLATVILGALALSLDVGRMYVTQSEIQTAADASALAAATRLIGTANSSFNAAVTGSAPLDPTTGNDNRFNLGTDSLSGGSGLATSVSLDYFNMVTDAKAGSNGGQAGPDAKYVRVDIDVEAPNFLARFLTRSTDRAHVRASAVAGISAPMCVVCGSDGIAVTALDPGGLDQDYGFLIGQYYTLYLNLTQQSPNLAACRALVPALLADTLQTAEYTVLNHTPVGPVTDQNGVLLELGAGGLSPSPAAATDTIPACVAIGSVETAMPNIQGTSCATATAARNLSCGLNTRFGIDQSGTACDNIAAATDLLPLFPGDTDPGPLDGTLQSFQTDYNGNSRRVLTVPIVDASSTLLVLNFRQFLVESSPNLPGVGVGNFRGPFRAQYLGNPVPVRLGTIGGSCASPSLGDFRVTRGVGKVVLF